MTPITHFFHKHFFAVPIHSLLPATFFLILGISWQAWIQSSWFLPGLLTIVMVTALSCYTHKITPIFWGTAFILGCCIYQRQIYKHAAFLYSCRNQKMAAIATVLDESPIRNNPRMKQLLKIHVQKICLDTPTPGTWKPVHADLCIYTTRPAFVQPGDRLALFDLKIQKTNNKGFEQYLIKEGIAASIYLTTLNHIIISRPKISVQRMIWHLKNNLTCRIQEKLSSKTFALFSALFLGNKQLVKKEMDQIKTYYKTWGISHHLARSGLHLVIFIMLWSFLLNLLPLPFIMKDVLLLSICFLYLFLSWTSISFLRAFSTFVLYKICSLNKVSITTIHALTLITWGTLVLNPMQLFSLDFQLSFSLTGALAWFNLVSHAQQTRQKTVDKKQYNALS